MKVDNKTCAIVMFDLTSPISYTKINYWLDRLRSLDPYIPVLLCGHKADIANREVKDIKHNKFNAYFETSSKYRCDQLFLYLIDYFNNANI